MVVILGLILKYPSPQAIRFFMSVIFIFFCPGYILLATLYPDNWGLSNLQRFLASIGSSVVVTSLLLLPVAYILGITITTTYTAISLLLVIMTIGAFFRRKKIKNNAVYKPFESWNFNIFHFWKQKKSIWKLDTFIIGITIIFILFSAGHLLWVTQGIYPRYSELFLLGKNKMAASYPEYAKPGETVHLTVGVIHHGKQAEQYLLTTQVDNEEPNSKNTQTFLLHPNEEKEIDVLIQLKNIEAIQKVNFVLYTLPRHKLQRELHFWIDTYPTK